MNYKVHRLDVSNENMQEELQAFLNTLKGHVISITPHFRNISLPQLFGMGSRIDYLLVSEKL